MARRLGGCTGDRGAAHTDDFWGRGKHENVDEDADVQDPAKPRCPNCNELCKSRRSINVHLARSKCKPVSKHVGHKTRRDVVRRKTKEDADELPKVDAQDTDLETVTVFGCLGSQIESDANTDRDVEARLGAPGTTPNQTCPLWISKSLSTHAKVNPHEVFVVTIARRGSESWCLTAKARKKLDGWNSRCLVTPTGRTHREEASTDATSFDFVATVRWKTARARRDRSSWTPPPTTTPLTSAASPATRRAARRLPRVRQGDQDGQDGQDGRRSQRSQRGQRGQRD